MMQGEGQRGLRPTKDDRQTRASSGLDTIDGEVALIHLPSGSGCVGIDIVERASVLGSVDVSKIDGTRAASINVESHIWVCKCF